MGPDSRATPGGIQPAWEGSGSSLKQTLSAPPRKKNRFLAPQEKQETWMQLVKRETTMKREAPMRRGKP
jgi:hypothetical protein